MDKKKKKHKKKKEQTGGNPGLIQDQPIYFLCQIFDTGSSL